MLPLTLFLTFSLCGFAVAENSTATSPVVQSVAVIAGVTIAFAFVFVFGVITLCWTIRSKKIEPEVRTTSVEDKNKWKSLFDTILVPHKQAVTMAVVDIDPRLQDVALLNNLVAEEKRFRRAILESQDEEIEAIATRAVQAKPSKIQLLVDEENEQRIAQCESEITVYQKLLEIERASWNILIVSKLSQRYRDSSASL